MHLIVNCPSPGGHSHWKGVWGCAAVMTPFSQASHRSLAYQFIVNAPLLCPRFQFLDFQPCFGQNSSSLDPKFSFPRPPFFKENPLPRPYILTPAWHTSTQKKLSAPPPPDCPRNSKNGIEILVGQAVFKLWIKTVKMMSGSIT